MYQLLSTNIEQVKANGETAKEREISVVVKTSDLEKGVKEPKLYAFRYGMIYDPADEFSPNIKGNQKIKDYHIEAYYQQKPAALKEYNRLLSLFENKGQGLDDKELELLRIDLKAKEIRIREQADRIAELQKQGQAPSGQTEQLKAMIDTMAKIQANRIEIVINKTTRILEKIVHENLQDVIELLAEKQAVYLYGPAGTGKSQLAEDAAEGMGLKFWPASTLTQEYKLSGFIDASGKYHETNFYRAFTQGGIFFLDEMDSSADDVLIGINGALANGYYDFPMGTEKAHENFRVIGAGNTIGRGADEKYTARKPLDLSTLDRFWGVECDYSLRIDMAVSNNDEALVQFAQAVRKAADELGINILMSYRSISRIATFQAKMDLVKIMKQAVIKGMASDDIRMLARNMSIDSTNKYYKAFKQAA